MRDDTQIKDNLLSKQATTLNNLNKPPTDKISVNKQLVSQKNDPASRRSSYCYDLASNFVTGLANELLGTLLLALPFGLIAWIFIAWGSAWLVLPIILIIGVVFTWLFKSFKKQKL